MLDILLAILGATFVIAQAPARTSLYEGSCARKRITPVPTTVYEHRPQPAHGADRRRKTAYVNGLSVNRKGLNRRRYQRYASLAISGSSMKDVPVLRHRRSRATAQALALFRGDKVQRHAVVAPALTGGLRTVIKDMPLVAAAACAVILGARYE